MTENIIGFAFEEEIRQSTEQAKNYVLDGVRGISYPSLGFGYVNLNADIWNDFMGLGTEEFNKAVSQTIVHEHLHLLIGTKAGPEAEPDGYSWTGEETVCRIMAGQPHEDGMSALVDTI